MSASLTRVTVVTSDDCATAVCNIPKNNPPNLFLLSNPLVKNDSDLSEAWTKPLDIRLMPTKKQPHAVKTSMIARAISLKLWVAASININQLFL